MLRRLFLNGTGAARDTTSWVNSSKPPRMRAGLAKDGRENCGDMKAAIHEMIDFRSPVCLHFHRRREIRGGTNLPNSLIV
jgi:hypothetical protein